MSEQRQLFWLHIKKSAGITTRQLLKPYYVEVDRVQRPKNFIQAKTEEFNDVLNNYRVVLGDYQFKRALFAKTYLYPDSWSEIVSFAFCREPVDRCVSMFFYLFWGKGVYNKGYRILREFVKDDRLLYSKKKAFDVFLDYLLVFSESSSNYYPLGLHFTTHVNPMFNDVTDLDGRLLLTRVYRLENLIKGINEVFQLCGKEERVSGENMHLNQNKGRMDYSPTNDQLRKIERIYFDDFNLYENAK